MRTEWEKESHGRIRRAGFASPTHLFSLSMILPFSSHYVQNMVNALFRPSKTLERLCGVVVVLGLLLAIPDFASAQSYQDRGSPAEPESQQQHEQISPSTSPSNLPDWAEPSQPQNPSVSPEPAAPPPPPPPPDQVPVDGGLALLAAAGAGYAVRKLGSQEGDELPV
jgi:hypothetical protein